MAVAVVLAQSRLYRATAWLVHVPTIGQFHVPLPGWGLFESADYVVLSSAPWVTSTAPGRGQSARVWEGVRERGGGTGCWWEVGERGMPTLQVLSLVA